ncbi:MAG: endo alpha-1,4 polygalactosaminidase [Chlamydiota bacterium]
MNSITATEIERWVVDYAEIIQPKEFKAYDVVVLDTKVGPELKFLQEQNKQTIGYLSLGQVLAQRDYFDLVKKEGLLIEEDPDWPGSYTVDIRKKEWVKLVIEKLIPQVLFKRFNGVMLDTVDQVAALEQKDPEKYRGMTEAAAHLIQAMRKHYPQMTIMMNRGYEIVPQVADSLDILLGESVYTKYDFQTKSYKKVSPDDYKWQVEKLNQAREVNPLIQIFTLDYWDPEDKEFIKEIYRLERENGFIPYVSTIDLQRVIPEP